MCNDQSTHKMAANDGHTKMKFARYKSISNSIGLLEMQIKMLGLLEMQIKMLMRAVPEKHIINFFGLCAKKMERIHSILKPNCSLTAISRHNQIWTFLGWASTVVRLTFTVSSLPNAIRLLTDLLTKSAAHNLAVFLEGNVGRWITAGTCTNYGSPSACDDLWGVCGHIYRIWGNYKADNKVFQVQLIYFTIKFATRKYELADILTLLGHFIMGQIF